MSYVKINWQAGTLLTARRFAHMDTQYDIAKAFTDGKYDDLVHEVRAIVRWDTTLELRMRTYAGTYSGNSAEVILETSANEFKGNDGSTWLSWGEKYDV